MKKLILGAAVALMSTGAIAANPDHASVAAIIESCKSCKRHPTKWAIIWCFVN